MLENVTKFHLDTMYIILILKTHPKEFYRRNIDYIAISCIHKFHVA